jgi:transcription elongation factor Elf1
MTISRTAAPELKLVCKCGSCTHWEIILKTGDDNTYASQYLVCVACGLEVDCQFNIGPHEGLHYEKHVKGDEKEANACVATTVVG